MKPILLGSIAAISAQPVLFFVWASLSIIASGRSVPVAELLRMSWLVLAVAMLVVVALGVPLFLGLRKAGRASFVQIAAAGFVLAGALAALLSWPGGIRQGSTIAITWHGKLTAFVVDGEVTIWGWLNYLEVVTRFALHGLVGAALFFKVWRKHAA